MANPYAGQRKAGDIFDDAVAMNLGDAGKLLLGTAAAAMVGGAHADGHPLGYVSGGMGGFGAMGAGQLIKQRGAEEAEQRLRRF
jgi:hypothetical protein